jgi:hypothetical protein
MVIQHGGMYIIMTQKRNDERVCRFASSLSEHDHYFCCLSCLVAIGNVTSPVVAV